MNTLIAFIIGTVVGGMFGTVCGFLVGCAAAVASGRDRTAHDATVYTEGYADGKFS